MDTNRHQTDHGRTVYMDRRWTIHQRKAIISMDQTRTWEWLVGNIMEMEGLLTTEEVLMGQLTHRLIKIVIQDQMVRADTRQLTKIAIIIIRTRVTTTEWQQPAWAFLAHQWNVITVQETATYYQRLPRAWGVQAQALWTRVLMKQSQISVDHNRCENTSGKVVQESAKKLLKPRCQTRCQWHTILQWTRYQLQINLWVHCLCNLKDTK